MKFSTTITLAIIASVSAFAPIPATRSIPRSTTKLDLSLKEIGGIALAGVLALGVATAPGNAMTKDDLNQLSYLQVKGTGLANRCSDVEGEGHIVAGRPGQHLVDFCIEPKSFAIEEEFGNKDGRTEKKFVNAKVMTRQTYTLDAMEGPLFMKDGNLVFEEKDGLDYAPITLKSPLHGEGLPMLFNVKGLVAKGDGNVIQPGYRFSGDFNTPSYRTGLFQDPKGRGGTTGYDMAIALPALQSGIEGDDRLFRENNKIFDVSQGHIEMEVSQVDEDSNEIGGVFVQTQLGDSDMGAHDAKRIITKGIYYGRIE